MKNNKKIAFSVLMSIYYKENSKYFSDALKSVFDQTLLPSEIVLVEDGKLTDDLYDEIDKWVKKYPKIFNIVVLDKNQGLGKALSVGLVNAKNEIILRMDTDDICEKSRFEKQINFFSDNNYDVVGTNITEYDSNMENIFGNRIMPEKHDDICKMMKKRNGVNHVTVAFRKSSALEAGNYQSMLYFEDYYLWIRMIKKGYKFYNIQENLVNVRGGKEMLQRRGGSNYFKAIIHFENSIYKLGFINFFEMLTNCFIRITVSAIPGSWRGIFYKKILRK